MDKKEKGLLITGIVIAGGLGLYYLFENKGKFSIGYVPNYTGTNVAEFVSGFGNNSPTNSVNTSCPSGYTYANGVCNLNTVSCPSGYTLSNGECLQNQPTTTTATPAYNTNISYYDTGSTVLQGLNTGLNSLVRSLENTSGFYTNSSSVLQACQDVAQRVNDYFPNNSLVPQFVTAYTTAYQNGNIGSVYQQALSGAYNDIQFINNFIQLVNSGYGVSSATTATSAYNTNISYYDTGSTVLKGLNTGLDSIISSLFNMTGFYTNPSSVLQACQDIAQRVNDYFPNNTLVPQFVTAYTTAYNNSTIGSVFKQAQSGAYNDIQFINNFIQLVNSGYGLSSATTATATATPATVTFSGTAGALNGTLFTISGSGNTLSGSTDIGYTAGGSNWVSSGAITYSNGSFSGSLGNVGGTLTTISGSGNTLVGSTDTGWVLNNGQSSWQNSGSITYNPSNNTFSGSIGDVQGSTFVLYGQGNQLVSQVNTNTLGSSGSGWQPAGSITATQS